MISIRGVTKSYGGRLVLDCLDLDLAPDVVYVLRGPSGAGKSTLLNIIMGYVTPDAGTVTRDERVGYLLQDESLFSTLPVADMLRLRFLGLATARLQDSEDSFWRNANRWLEVLGLARLREAEIGTLSGGERRRLEIAAIMLGDPGVLLMDEPTSCLDPGNARTVYQAVWGVRGRRAVVIATHDPAIPDLPRSARELFLDHGKVRESCVAG